MWFGSIGWNEKVIMYKIEIHVTPLHRIHAEYSIPGDLIIIRRHSYVDDKLEDINIGLSIKELLNLACMIKIRKGEHEVGIDPPEYEIITGKHESYMDDM